MIILNKCRLVCLLLFVLFICLLSACGVRKQSQVKREVTTQIVKNDSDSMFLRELCQSVHNQSVRIEHIRFNESDSLSSIPSFRSITRIAIDERVQQEAMASIETGSVSKYYSYKEENMQKDGTVRLSSGKPLLIVGILLFLFIICRFFIGKASRK